jgi:hypothetical protein
MKRLLLFAALLILVPSVAAGKRAPSRTPVQSAAVASVILVGTVTEIGKEPVIASSSPGIKDKVEFTVATLKVTDPILGIKDATHVKVGFQPNARSPLNLAEKGEYLLFLTKHHDGGFYVMNWMSPPLAITADTKASVVEVKAIGKILADPAKALKAEKAEDKSLAAAVLAMHYRSPSETGVEQTTEALPLDESQSILKALAATEWGATPQVGGYDLMRSFYQLGITDKDGWKQPAFKPGENAATAMHKAFTEWLAGPGAKYQIQKFVAKTK